MKTLLFAVLILCPLAASAEPFTPGEADAQTGISVPVSADAPVAEGTGLVCTCHGGPGNYAYACAPVHKTCYGGPGYYPYDCSTCPEN